MVTRKFKHSHLFQSTRYNVSDILPQRNLRNNSLSALVRANSPEIVFPDDSFVNQNTSENKNGQFRSASDFCTQEPLPSQKSRRKALLLWKCGDFSFRLSRYSLQACLTL